MTQEERQEILLRIRMEKLQLFTIDELREMFSYVGEEGQKLHIGTKVIREAVKTGELNYYSPSNSPMYIKLDEFIEWLRKRNIYNCYYNKGGEKK